MRSVFAALSEADEYPSMVAQVRPRAFSRFQTDSRMRREMAARVTNMWRQTGDSEFLYDMAIKLGGPQTERFLARVARAITWDAWKAPFWQGKVTALRDTAQLPFVHKHLPKWGKLRKIEGVLDYVIYHHPDDVEFWISARFFLGSYWLLRCLPAIGAVKYPERIAG